jgi:hypothetical protein
MTWKTSRKEWNRNTKHNGRPLEQTRKSRRQNTRTWRKKWKLKEKWKTISQTIQDLWKEYARTHWFHQKTKPENHGHWRKRKGASKRIS